MPALEGAVAIAAEQRRTVALMGDGEVRCVGACPATLPDLPPLTQLSVSRRGLFGIDEGGALWWSRYWLSAERIGGIARVSQVAAGDRHVCMRHRDGAVSCLGANLHGQLGVPRTDACDDECGPLDVPLPARAVEVIAGEAQSCALLEDARVFCWGQLGDREVVLAEPVPSLAGSTRVFAGSTGVVCGRAADGALSCVLPSSTRLDPASLGPATAVALSYEWTYTDRIWRYLPHEDRDGYVFSDEDAARLRDRVSHACAVLADGSLACAGADYVGQLGRGRWAPGAHPPAPVRSARVIDPPPPPPPSADPGWERLRAMPRHCPLEVARDPSRVTELRTESCAFGPPSCRAIVAPGWTLWRGYHDDTRGYFGMYEVQDSPPSGERIVTAVGTTDLEIVGAWAGPTTQFWCNEDPRAPRCPPGVDYAFNCRVGGVAIADDHIAISIWNYPWPTRVLHAPLDEASARRQPTFQSAFPVAAAVSASSVVFQNSGVPMWSDERTTVSAPNYPRHLNARGGLVLFDRDVLFWEQPDQVIVGGLDVRARELLPRGALAFGTDGEDLVWFVPSAGPDEAAEVWTSPHTLRPGRIVARRVGATVGVRWTSSTSLTVGAGRVAWVETPLDEPSRVYVLDLADGTRRRLDVPYHIDAGHSQLLPPLFLTATEVFVPTVGGRTGNGNRVYRVRIDGLAIEP